MPFPKQTRADAILNHLAGTPDKFYLIATVKKLLDLDQWERKEHFDFFRHFEEPFFGVCFNIDCTNAYVAAKERGESFFLTYLHKSLIAANRVKEFRYRVEGPGVMEYDVVHASSTIPRHNGTFGFSHFDYHPVKQDFFLKAQQEIEWVRQSSRLFSSDSQENVIHYTTIPWVSFTGLSHARAFAKGDSCPKIAFGKIIDDNGKKLMPVSIHVHHALMDGYHVGLFTALFQQLMDEKSLE